MVEFISPFEVDDKQLSDAENQSLISRYSGKRFCLALHYTSQRQKMFFLPRISFQFEFLIFSIVNMGFYCKHCATVMSGYSDFKSENKSIKLGDFVVSARKNFINFSKKAKEHQESEYYKQNTIRAMCFLRSRQNPKEDIRLIAQKNTNEILHAGRIVLSGVIDTIKVLCKNSIPLRGHRDNEPIEFSRFDIKQGNFKYILSISSYLYKYI